MREVLVKNYRGVEYKVFPDNGTYVAEGTETFLFFRREPSKSMAIIMAEAVIDHEIQKRLKS